MKIQRNSGSRSRKVLIPGILIFASLVVLPFPSQCNPIVTPVITEIQFTTGGGYSLELDIYAGQGNEVLDNYRIVGLNGTGYFIPGTPIPQGEILVVTEADFDPPFPINPEGDYLYVEQWYEDEWYRIDYLGMTFGDVPAQYQSQVNAPAGEESIAYQVMFSMWNSECWALKELPNTLGTQILQVNRMEEFSGYVRNLSQQPLPFIELVYCNQAAFPYLPVITTDDSGFFHVDSIYCRKYFIQFMNGDFTIGYDTVDIDPDSANFFEFYFDYMPTSTMEFPDPGQEYSISNSPNPLTGHSRFIITSPATSAGMKGVIKIYNAGGAIVNIIPVWLQGGRQEVPFGPVDFPGGMFIYALEISGRALATGKMVTGP